MGRPEIYTKELADKICTQIATSSKSLRSICKGADMPHVETVMRWLRENKDGFCEQYARAKEEQADFMCEEMLEIADDTSNDDLLTEYGVKENKEWVNRSRLRIDTRKWLASKLKAKKYGNKIEIEHKDNNAINYDDFVKKINDI